MNRLIRQYERSMRDSLLRLKHRETVSTLVRYIGGYIVIHAL